MKHYDDGDDAFEHDVFACHGDEDDAGEAFDAAFGELDADGMTATARACEARGVRYARFLPERATLEVSLVDGTRSWLGDDGEQLHRADGGPAVVVPRNGNACEWWVDGVACPTQRELERALAERGAPDPVPALEWRAAVPDGWAEGELRACGTRRLVVTGVEFVTWLEYAPGRVAYARLYADHVTGRLTLAGTPDDAFDYEGHLPPLAQAGTDAVIAAARALRALAGAGKRGGSLARRRVSLTAAFEGAIERLYAANPVFTALAVADEVAGELARGERGDVK